MLNTKKLLKDNIINREKLLLSKSTFIDLDSEEVLFLLKIIPFLEDDSITFEKIINNTPISKSIIDNVLSNLLSKRYVKSFFKKEEKQVIFNFTLLWEKLLDFYNIPNENSSFDDKVDWFINILNFKKEQMIVDKLQDWINQKDWKHLVSLINKIKASELDKISWNSFVNIHDQIFEKNSNFTEESLKEIISFNWLEN